KISKTSNTETKLESSGKSVSTENNADTKTDSKASAPTRSQDESSAQVRKDEESKVNSPTRLKVQVQHTGDSNRYHPIHHDHIHTIRNMLSPEASIFVDSYCGAVEAMVKDVELIELRAHPWLLEFLLKNKIALKESVKIGFILKPHEVEKLELDSPGGGGGERNEIVTEKTLIEKGEEKKNSIKPEMWLELVFRS
ncbi:22753_t:CDS:2, partial [Gigaspora margarita]